MDIMTKRFLTEIMPQVESEYRVVKHRNGRAITVLSSGSMESLDSLFNHANLFAWVGSFSAGDLLRSTHPLPTNARQPRLWITCGTDDDLLAPTGDCRRIPRRAIRGWTPLGLRAQNCAVKCASRRVLSRAVVANHSTTESSQRCEIGLGRSISFGRGPRSY
jgi:hypothetical protein